MKTLNINTIESDLEEIAGKIVAKDIFDESTGEVICQANEAISEEKIHQLLAAGVKNVEVLYIDMINYGDQIRNTLLMDKTDSSEDALVKIFERLRPGEPPAIEAATSLFQNLFFNGERYDLSKVGRMKINYKFGLDIPDEQTILTKDDIVRTIQYLVDLNNGKGKVDDIDHLGNRRVRAVGELLENQFRVGLVRMERAVKERMAIQEIETMMPYDLVNQKPVAAAVKEFFGSSQLSQFMDQTNPLSEITHKRRLSALGPGGLTRERAGFEVRDVHPTHYGRICPVETPEGPNIGLIVSLSTFARVNEFGFIETPYRNVKGRKATKEVSYMTALDEQEHVIAQAKTELNGKGKIVPDTLIARQDGEVLSTEADAVTQMDVSPNQLVSVAASLIPFLENDDANRALMGSNMQRQGVPLLRPEAPLIGTGLELTVAKDSGVCLLAGGDGVVEEVDANRVVVRYDKPGTDGFTTGIGIYRLEKYKKSNQNTCFTQRPLVNPGLRVKKGDILADGPACDQGELAIGKNVTIAFMPWRGFNFEDSILINERLLKEDTFTSVHIEVFETMARDTKLGKEEITRDIPNVSEETLRNLDDSGIVRIGAEVKAGDTLVGKVTPKGETVPSPEEKLLRVIF